MGPGRRKRGGFDTKCNLMLDKVRLSAGSGFCGGRAAVAGPQRRGKTIGATVAKCSSLRALQGLNPAISFVVVFFPPPLRNGDRLPWTEQPLCPYNDSPPPLCVQVSADCLMDPVPTICLLRAADLADGLIQHYAERPAALTCNAANGRVL